MLRLDGLLKGHGGELGQASGELSGGRSHFPVEMAIVGVDHLQGVGNGLGAIVDQAVQAEVLAGILEEILLRPTGEHGYAQGGRLGAIIGTQNGGLMAALGALAQLPNPQTVTQAGSPFGQVHGHTLTAWQSHLGG